MVMVAVMRFPSCRVHTSGGKDGDFIINECKMGNISEIVRLFVVSIGDKALSLIHI